MGLPYYQMLEMYPKNEVVAFSSNYRLYGDMSERVMLTVKSEVPRLLQYSIDEAFIDLRNFFSSDFKIWGEKLAAKVYKWTGIPVSIGIAPTKTLAKISAKYAKKYPGYKKCCLIGNELQRVKALENFDIEDVWGIGRRIARSLHSAGVRSAYDFTLMPRQWIKARYHVPGERTWLELRGINAVPEDEMGAKQKQSIMTSRSFPAMLTDIDDIRTHIANFAAKCALKLRRQNSLCRHVMVFLQSNFFREDLPQYNGSDSYVFLTPTNSTQEIVNIAVNLLSSVFKTGIHYKRGGVMVSEIVSAKAFQPDLFEFDITRNRKLNSISKTLDKINGIMGDDTLRLACQLYTSYDPRVGKPVKFTHAIKRALLSPDYSTSYDAFTVYI